MLGVASSSGAWKREEKRDEESTRRLDRSSESHVHLLIVKCSDLICLITV